MRYALDRSARLIDHGRVLIGGSPLRLLRLAPGGSKLVAELADGQDPAIADAGRAKLVERLTEAGLAHPQPAPRPPRQGEVTVVIPTYADDAALAATLAALAAMTPDVPVVVVDDGGPDPRRTAAVARAHGAQLLRLPANRGPAAARNRGLAAVHTPVVTFLDAGCTPQGGWLDPLLALLDLPGVVLAAPRITAADADRSSVIGRYEAAQSSLDRGLEPAPVRPNTKVPFVPAACLAARADAVRELGGFDETMRVGEDVDLVWRAGEAGLGVRYEPGAVVAHRHRTRLAAFLRRRFDYGTSAAALQERHPGAVAPLRVSGWSLAVWATIAARRPFAASALLVGTTAALARRLDKLEHPLAEAIRLGGLGNLLAGRAIAGALVRPWWPAALVAGLTFERVRPVLLAALLAPPALDWQRRRPDVDLPRWLLLHVADDVAYATGVWAGCLRARSTGALLPDLSSWPGRRPAVGM